MFLKLIVLYVLESRGPPIVLKYHEATGTFYVELKPNDKIGDFASPSNLSVVASLRFQLSSVS